MPVDPPTFEEFYADYRTKVVSVDDTLTDWSAGSNLDALGGASAMTADESVAYALKLHRDRFFDTVSSSQALDELMLDRLGLTRKPAVAAVGTIIWNPTVTPAYAIPVGTSITGTLAGGGGSYTVVTTEAAVSDSGLPIPVRATSTGPSGNVAAGTLTGPSSFPADGSATVTQASRMAGGADVETDDAFIARGRVYYQSLEGGTVDALTAAALGTPGVAYTLIDELFSNTGNSQVTVYIADSEGAGNLTLAASADVFVQAKRAAGILVRTLPAARELPPITVTVSVGVGGDVEGLRAASFEAAQNYLNSVPPGAPWYASEVAQEIHNARADAKSVVSRANGVLFDALEPSARQNSLRADQSNLTVEVVEVS